jgi:putative restriction endonuclease
LGITPDSVVQIREDILEEVDGPMLKHGLQEMHGSKLVLPRSKKEHPDKDALEFRYRKFLAFR